MCGHTAGPGERGPGEKAHTCQEVSMWLREARTSLGKADSFKDLFICYHCGCPGSLLLPCRLRYLWQVGPLSVAGAWTWHLQWRLLLWSTGLEHRLSSRGAWACCPKLVSTSWTMDLTPALASRFLTIQTRRAPNGLLINGGSTWDSLWEKD